MELYMIVVLAMTAAFLGFCIRLQLQSRRKDTNSESQNAAGSNAAAKSARGSEENTEKEFARRG
jgi:hypothetical protein